MDFEICFFLGHFGSGVDPQGIAACSTGISTKLSTETLDDFQSPDKSTT
jgi:hypothetical protein